ncbi:virion structural protein [Erwinia phage PhiEaH1]|uniref:Uncharacterized protein n=1 Tax=Erwinia phage PhiEaH1 TaxID=1401669 RepID=W8CZV6_9CAUD|nr:virion structural protein [Erwinia phage PhiEaH1]AGX01725.1 hypothetical protein [Erwinia phage PhiEaH1]
MFESNLMGKKSGKILLDINFANATVGDKTIIDSGPLGIPLTRGVVAGGANGDGVVNDPTYGKCYYFDGYAYFQNLSPVLDLAGSNYELTIELALVGSGFMCTFATGDYPAANNIKKGLELLHNQLSQPIQVFQTTDAGAYQRTYGYGSANNQMLKLTVKEDSANITVSNNQNSNQAVAARFRTGGDSYLMLGTSHGLVNRFTGYLKSLRVVKL